jgi:hypothetical protein
MQRRSMLSATERQRRRLCELRRSCQATADTELEYAARKNGVQFSSNNTISGTHGVISAIGIPGLVVQFRLEPDRRRAEDHRCALATAGFLKHIHDPIPWILIWDCNEGRKTSVAIAIISPAKHEWPPDADTPW